MTIIRQVSLILFYLLSRGWAFGSLGIGSLSNGGGRLYASDLNIPDNISPAIGGSVFDLKLYVTFIIFLSKLRSILIHILSGVLLEGFMPWPWNLRGVIESTVGLFQLYLVVIEVYYVGREGIRLELIQNWLAVGIRRQILVEGLLRWVLTHQTRRGLLLVRIVFYEFQPLLGRVFDTLRRCVVQLYTHFNRLCYFL